MEQYQKLKFYIILSFDTFRQTLKCKVKKKKKAFPTQSVEKFLNLCIFTHEICTEFLLYFGKCDEELHIQNAASDFLF